MRGLRAGQLHCIGMGPSGSLLVRGGGESIVVVDYNASNLARRMAIARPKRTMGDAIPQDGNRVLIKKLGASSEGMG